MTFPQKPAPEVVNDIKEISCHNAHYLWAHSANTKSDTRSCKKIR